MKYYEIQSQDTVGGGSPTPIPQPAKPQVVESYWFDDKVKNMTAKEIILAMVSALRIPPIVRIDMATFGDTREITQRFFFGLVKRQRFVCFGCAATNTICQISGKVLTPKYIRDRRAEFVGGTVKFVEVFELAINGLRKGSIEMYNVYARRGEFAQVTDTGIVLPYLNNEYTNDNLEPYLKLAKNQP